VKAEHAAALKYIFQDEIYLLPNEISLERPAVAQPAVIPPASAEIAPGPAAQSVAMPTPIIPKIEAAPVNEPAAAPTPVIPKMEPVPVTQPQPVVQTPGAPFNYLGTNKKAFLIFTHYPDHEFIDQEHLTALQNILKRKEVELEDIAILNIAKTGNKKWADIYKFFTPKKVLVLGSEATPPGLNLPPLNQLKQAPAASLLYSFSFIEMMSSTDNKKAFWEQMKNL
jgi:hypothetical protein